MKAIQTTSLFLVRTVATEITVTGVLQVLVAAVDLPLLDSAWVGLLPVDLLARAVRNVLAQARRTITTTSKGTTMFTSQHIQSHTRLGRKAGALGALLTLSVTLGLGVAPTAIADTSAQAAPAVARQSAGPSVSKVRTEAGKADAALARAARLVRSQQYAVAVDALDGARSHTRKANVTAAALIGAPPTDPESDEPPGPPAVLTALKLDQRIATGSAALFDAQTNAALIDALTRTLRVAQVRRNDVLGRVTHLRPEGAGADYSDGMADTLGLFRREVAALENSLATSTLTPAARTALSNAVRRARAAEVTAQGAFGGGERRAAWRTPLGGRVAGPGH